ncbi:transcription factor Adf-1 [Eupeodes corollae]|uniref:transcription factor Adf-1 n=1 Tax=Eupeodes corollae TaxID=290404 RepID=UPI0024916BB7|nr:transcription factor Adf-1 [Eupeodes corollae]
MDPSDLELVRGVRATPALFDNTNSDFKFAYRKEKIWVELSEYLGINMNDARRRWTCLRDRYTRELKNRRLNPNIDYPQDEFYKEMDFLRPYVRKRKERSSIICKIKSKTSWDGRLDKHDYSTCDSSYSNNNCKLESDEQNTIEEVNVEEILHNYQIEKADSVSMVMDSNNEITEDGDGDDADEEETLNQENFEYQVQMITEDDKSPMQHATIQSCKIIAENPVEITPQTSKHQLNNSSKSCDNTETEDDFFCKSVCVYLRQLNRVHKIKAKVEMFKILQKYIEIEEGVNG